MSTTDPTGDRGGGGGGGGGGGLASITPTDDNVTPVTSSTGVAVSPASHHQQHPPPSPLSGCYLLVVLPEPHTAQHKDLILNRLAKGFLSWDKDSCHVDLEKELQALVAQAPEGEEARNGERLIQYATENLVTEVLIHPQTNTLLQCMRNLLASFTKHRHIIHAGYTFSGNGSWILQDGTFSLADFLDAFSEHEVQRVLRAYENSVTVDINCAGVGEWSTSRLSKEACTRSCRVRLNPDDVLTAGVPAITSFTSYVGQYLVSQTLDQLMEPSDVVGNIRFSHPTLYVFPGGQGDAALFGINGFNMLVDGGFARKACFWDFARHLDRLDAVLMTRINNSNVGGMSSVLRKKREMHVYPQIGHFFCNLIERKNLNSPDGDKDLDPLILNLTDIGHEMMVDLRHINLRAHPCYRDPNPINLYHKVGHGTLDMYVLSPSKDSREVREFLSKWHASDSKLFSGSYRKDSNNLTFPIQNMASICALLVWQPANPEDTITRILFPGSTPQHKIFEGIERLKHLEFLKHPVCTAKSISPSTSLLTLKDKPTTKQKLGLIEESKKASDAKREKRDLLDSKLSKAGEDVVSKPTPQGTPINQAPKVQPPKIDVKTKKVIENKKIETESKKIEKDLKEHKREPIRKDISKPEKDSDVKKVEGYKIKMDNEKAALTKEAKVKPEPKKKETKESKPVKIGKTEPVSKSAVRIGDKKPKPSVDKKDTMKASPTTPKKSMNGAATKVELSRSTPRPITKPSSKTISSTMPGKSAKDANNRKVVEQKNIEIASAESAATPASTKATGPPKQKVAERKPIGRRPKPISPIKARLPISPTKSTRSTPTTSVKSDKDGIIRKIKGDRGTADSSTVSTPSGIEIDSMTKLADKCLTEKSEDMSLDSIESKVLADLKEEREVVEEIEAVLQKAERIEGARRDDHLEGDDEITAEATDKKEDDMTEDDVTADIEEIPKKESSRKTSHELTEEDEYLIIEKEEIYIEDSVQSGEVEEKHAAGVVDAQVAKTRLEAVPTKEEEEEEEGEEPEDEEEEEQEEAEVSEEKEKADIPEKQLGLEEGKLKETEEPEKLASSEELLEEQMKNIIASTAEMVQKTEDKDDSGKKDSEDITKEPSSLSPDKFDSSEKKTTDTDVKPEIDQKDRQVLEKLEESHERMSTLESGATTTAPTLPEDERIPLDEIKEVVDEKCLVDQDTKPDSGDKVPEPMAAQIPPETKPDAKAFEVHPPLHGIQREIVKTPDEVADLPVHEEVDPNLYRMEHFEKGKEEKPTQAAPPQKEIKEPEVPLVKEQKGVFSFFGKVADKFEKGMDKLTGKSRRDSEKDIDEKSSSKSGSPKEVKAQSIVLPGEVATEEASAGLVKVAEASELPEDFEKGTPEITKVKVAAIKDTATFLADEIEDAKRTSPLPKEPIDAKDDKSTAKLDSVAQEPLEPVFETCVLTHTKDKLDRVTAELEGDEDVEEVEALLAEASKKFQDVKDSLHDSLESLEEKMAQEEMARAALQAASQDFVKDTLSEVVEKLEDIKPKDLEELPEKKGLEEAEQELPEDEDLDDEKEEAVVTKDLKGAVRDVGGVLAGSAGILIDDKPKDVIEIVKKVAEVLKKDDFLSHDVLFDANATDVKEQIGEDDKPSEKLSTEAAIIPTKVGVTEELPSQEEIEELRESRRESTISLTAQKAVTAGELHEDTTAKTSTIVTPTPSPTKDTDKDKMEAMKICAESLEDEPISSRRKRSVVEDPTKKDVVEAGMEAICVKQIVEKPMSTEGDSDHKLNEQSITFDRKVSPVTAEVVIVTPDLSPTSPMLPSDKIHTEDADAKPEGTDVSQLLPSDILNALQNEGSLEKVIEELVFTKKIKITREIIEYIIIIRRISRYDVISIIESLIIKKGSPPESVITDINLLTEDIVSRDKREEIEKYINEEYVMKNKKITMKIIEDISIQKGITKRVLNTIIILIIIKKRIPREALLDLSEKEYLQLDLDESTAEEQDRASQASEISGVDEDEGQEITSPSADKYIEVKNFIENEIVVKGQKITPQLIDDVCVTKLVPGQVFIDIVKKIMIERKIPLSSMVNISEKEMSELLASEKGDEVISQPEQEDKDAHRSVSVKTLWNLIDNAIGKEKLRRIADIDISASEVAKPSSVEEDEANDISSVASNRSDIENSIVEEFVSKKRRITPYIFEDICLRYKAPRRLIIEIIEIIIVKKNLQRNSILDITDTELSELLAVVEAEDEEESEGPSKSPVTEQVRQDDIDEDKLVDGFVSISSQDEVKVEGVLRKKSVEPIAKESEKDVDDFEAVEQEYKIYGLSLTPDKELPLSGQATSGDKIVDEVEDTVHDQISEVVEAKEKVVASAAAIVPTTEYEEKSGDISEHSETIDTTEKYLIEAQEKTEVAVSKPESISPAAGDIKSSEITIDKDAHDISIGSKVQESGVKDTALEGLEGEAKLGQTGTTPSKVAEVTLPEIPDNDAKMATAARKPSTTVSPTEQVELEKIESKDESKKIEDEIHVTVTKRDSHGAIDQVKDASMVMDTEDVASQPGSVSPKDDKSLKEISINEDTPLSSSTVHRMVVTASSEDGGHEMEVCPTGSITFTPDDSLKSSPIKTTPDQDSLRLDKESVHSGTSTPERDSISDKSATGTKESDKVTPEDSLDKSPFGTRDSQDLEDSLDKSDLIKLKETKVSEPLPEELADTATHQISEASKAIDEKLQGLDDADEKVPIPVVSTDVSTPESEMKKLISEKDDTIADVIDLQSKVSSGELSSGVTKDSESLASEKAISSHAGSPTADTHGATETGTDHFESSTIYDQKPVGKEDISETSFSLASEIQSANELKIATDLSDHSGISTAKVVSEPSVQSKSPSPSIDYGLEDIHERPKRSSVLDETVSGDDRDSGHTGSTTAATQEHKMEEVEKALSSHDISPSDADRSQSTTILSDVKHKIDDPEEKKIPELPDMSKALDTGKTEDKTRTPVKDSHLTKSEEKNIPELPDMSKSLDTGKTEDKTRTPVEDSQLMKSDNEVSSTVIDGKHDADKEPLEQGISSSVDREKETVVDSKESTAVARSPSLIRDEDESVAESQTVTSKKSPTDDSISPAIMSEKKKDSESIERSRSSSICAETHDESEKTLHPRLSIVEGDDHDQSEISDYSKSPGVSAEIPAEKDVIGVSETSSMVTEKQDEKAEKGADRLESPTVALETQEEKGTFDRSKSPIVVGEEASMDRSRSASIIPETHDRKESVDQSKPDSLPVQKEQEKGTMDHSKSPSMIDTKEDDKDLIDHSKSPSVAAEKEDEKEQVDRSRSSSISPGKQDAEESMDQPQSPSVATEKQDEKETIDRSKSPSVASEKENEKESVDRSRSTSPAPEERDAKESVDGAKSPSIATPKPSEKETIDRSKSPSVASEKDDETELIDHSRSTSLAPEGRDEKESFDRSRSASLALEKPDSKESIAHPKSPSVAADKEDEKESLDRSRSPSVVGEKQDKKETIDYSKSPTATSEKEDAREPIERSRSASITPEKQDEQESIDRSRSPSVLTEKQDEKETTDRSKSPSVTSEKDDGKESIIRSRSPSVAAEKQDAKDATDRSKSPSVASEKEDGRESVERSRSASLVPEKHDEKKPIDRPGWASLATERQDEKESIDELTSHITEEKQDEKASLDGSKSLSVASEKEDEKQSIDRSRSPSIAMEKHDQDESIARSKSPSVVSEKEDEKEAIGRSKSASPTPETRDGKEPIDRSRSPSVSTEKHDEKESIDRSKSPSVAGETEVGKESIDRSRSASIAPEKQEEDESIDRSKSASEATEKEDEKESTDRSRSASVVAEKQGDKEFIDRSKSPSVASEKEDDKGSIDRSRSPSVVTEKHGEKEIIDRSRSASLAPEARDEKELSDRSRSPSVVGEKHDEKPSIDHSKSPSKTTEKEDEKESIDRSRSASISAEKQDEKESIDRSKSPSVASEKGDEKELIDRSRSCSLAPERQDGKESNDHSRSSSVAPEKHDEKESIDRSKSPSGASEKEDDKGSIDRSRSPSVVTEKPGEKKSTDRSKSPSVASEKEDDKGSVDRSRSPSVVTEKQEEKESTDRSKSPSVASEKHDDKGSIDRSRSPSVATERQGEKESTDRSKSPSLASEKEDGKASLDRSRSPSVVAERQGQKELFDRSKSPSVASEKEDDKGSIDRSRSPSVVTEKQGEKESTDRSKSPSVASEKEDGKGSIDRSRSPSVVTEKQGDKESTDRSKSPSVASEKEDGKASIDRSRSPSVVTERQEEKELTDRSKSPSVASEKDDDKRSIDRSRSPSVVTEKQEEKELTDRSKSPSVPSEKVDDKESIDRSRSPSVVTEKQGEKESTDRSKSPSVASEKDDDKGSIDRSRSPSVVTEKQGEKESTDRSKSPSVASEKDDDKGSIDRSRSPSVVTEKQGEKESTDRSKSPSVASEKDDDKGSIDRSRSPSVVTEKQGAKETTDRSKSPSVASEKDDDKGLIDRSRSPSVVTEKQGEKELIDRSKSPSVASEKEDDKGSIDRSRSPSVVTEKQGAKETTDRSKSPSVASEKELIDRSRSASIVAERQDGEESKDRSRTPSVAGEIQNEKESLDGSRSPSIAGEKHSEKELTSRSRSASITIQKSDEKESTDDSGSRAAVPEKQVEKESIGASGSQSTPLKKEDAKESFDRSRSSSIIGEKQSPQESVDRSRSASIVAGKMEEKESVDGSRSLSMGLEKPDEKESIDSSKSPSKVDEKKDEKETFDRSRSASMVSEKLEEKESADRSKSPSIASEKQDEKELFDRLRSPSISGGKQDVMESVDRSKSPSIAGEKQDGDESDRSRSPSIAGEKQVEKQSVDRSRSASIASEKPDAKGSVDGSKSPSIASGQQDEGVSSDRSRSGSIAGGRLEEKESIDRSRTPSIAGEKHEDKESIGRSRSASIAVGKQDDKEVIGRSRSASIAVGQQETELTDRSRSASIVAEKQDEKEEEKESVDRSRSGSVVAEKTVDRSRSSSIIAEKQTEQFDRSRLPSLAAEKTAEKTSADGSRSASISPQEHIEKVPTDGSEASITAAVTQKDGSVVHSRSSSIGGEKRDAEHLVDHSRSPSIFSDNQDKIESSVRSESLKSTDAQQEKKETLDSSKTVDVSKPPADAISDKSSEGSAEIEKHEADEPIDLSSTASVASKVSGEDACKRTSIVDAHSEDKKSPDISTKSVTSVPTVQDCKLDETHAVQAMQKLAETIADKSLACDIKDGGALHDVETVEHGITHDKSRSHSLFDVGEKTPKSRSPTASLIDDEVPEVSKPSDQATIMREDVSRKSSMADVSREKLDQLPSDSKKFCTTEFEGALLKRGSVEIAKDIAGRFAEDYHTTPDEIAEIEEYIVNKYIAKKEQISPQIVEEIVTLYSISRNLILELIEAIIIEKNVPRDVVVSFPKDDKMKVSDVMAKDDHVAVIDIPPAKQHEVETRIYQEFVTKNKKITSLVINELAAMTFISRHIIIMIIQKMVRDQKGLTADLLESGILDESTTEDAHPEATHGRSSETKSVNGHESSIHDDGHSESHFPSATTDVMSHSDTASDDTLVTADSQRMEVETYIMEECVKKRIKINLLVLEQIIMRMGVPRSVLLGVIEQIILSGKVPRAELIDDAIYDEVEKASDRLSESEEKGLKELMSSKDRLIELSGKSTPDPKSSGYSTPEVRHYDDKFGKGMVSYSTDYESPFHKAFVGGMTEIRTTHITTLSGKSTPDYSVRGETPESLSDRTIQTKLEEKFNLDGVTSSQETTTTAHTTDVIVTTATTFTTSADTMTEPPKSSHLRDEMEIIEGTRPVTELEIHKQEIVDQPQMVTKIVESSSPDRDGDYEVHTISRTIQETSSPETVEIITVKTIETSVTDEMTPETIMSKLGSLDGTQDVSVTEHTLGDVKTVTTTVTMTTESDREISPHEIVEKIVGESGSKTLEKVGEESSTSTRVISKVTYTAPLDTQQTDKLISDLKESTTSLKTTLTSESQSRSDRDTTDEDSGERVEKSKSASQTLSERIGFEKLDHPISPVIKDLISNERSFTGRISPDAPPSKESQQGGSASYSTTDMPSSPLFRDSGMGHGPMSGRSTPDKRGSSRSSTATPEGVRSNEVIRTTITTTRTMSDEGDIITTTMEITETTNEKGETIILAEKTDVKVEDRIIPDDMSKSTLSSGFEAMKAPIDLSGEADVDQVSPRSDHSSVRSRAGTHVWEGSEERYTYSDDDVPGSPLSTTSQVGYSPQSTYPFEDHSFDKGSSRKSMEFSVADMSASFYGELPDLPPRVTTIKTTHLDSSDTEASGSSAPAESDFSFKKFTVAKEFAGISRDGKSDGKKYIDEADLDFEKALTGDKETKTEKELSSVGGTSSSHETPSSQSQIEDKKPEPKSESKKDPLAGWGSPLGLPSPKPPRKFNLRTVARPPVDNVVEESPDSINFDPINDWGEPLRLPSPAPVVDEGSNKGAPSTPKKERKQPKKIISENIKNRKRSESPAKNDKKTKDAKAKIQPVYIDLTYVPHHGNSYYTSVEFFKRVRARYYVFSGTEPSREVYDALLDAKKTWEDKDLEVTMIPTYDTDTLGYWVADNEEALAANHIDLSPSASRCTINLQDHETSCSAYRLEF